MMALAASSRYGCSPRPTFPPPFPCPWQNDFFESGSFSVPEAEAVVPVINKLREKHFDLVFTCTTHHPLNHTGFASNNPVR